MAGSIITLQRACRLLWHCPLNVLSLASRLKTISKKNPSPATSQAKGCAGVKLLLTLWWRTVKYFPPSPGGPIPGTRPQNLGRFKTEPGNALKVEMVDTRKFGTRRAENPARVAARKIADGWRGVTSVVTRVVNGRCEQPVLTLPRVP